MWFSVSVSGPAELGSKSNVLHRGVIPRSTGCSLNSESLE
jgi:hypothetical protein